MSYRTTDRPRVNPSVSATLGGTGVEATLERHGHVAGGPEEEQDGAAEEQSEPPEGRGATDADTHTDGERPEEHQDE